jgi:hypothetical protein
MSDHAPASPSSLSRHARCPGNIREVAKLPPEVREQNTKAAEDGTRRHELLYLSNKKGYQVPSHHPNPLVSQEDDRLVELAWPYFRDHPARTSDVGLWLPEEKVEIAKHIPGVPDDYCRGTADVVAAFKETVEVIDAKFGRVLVNPDCEQLWAYAFGGVRKLLNADGTWISNHRQTKLLKLTIVQPQAPEVVNSVVFPLADKLREIKAWLERTLKATLDPEAPLVPGDHCKWCAARETCPARREAAFESVRSMFDAVPAKDRYGLDPLYTPGVDLPDRPEWTTDALSEVDIIERIIEEHMSKAPDDLTPEEKGRILDLAPMVEQWLKDLRESCEKVFMDGKLGAEGWKMIRGRGSREWVEEDEEATAGELKKLGLKVREIYIRKLISPAQAEKIPAIAGNKAKAHKLRGLWVKKPGKPILVPESDPAPGIDPLHAQMFDDLDSAQPTAEETFDWM